MFIWFLEWPLRTSNFHNSLWYSTAMNAPTGMNILATTSTLAASIAMVPFTYVFGPVASLNMTVLMAPTLSSLAMYSLSHRFITRDVVRLTVGAIYGFSLIFLDSLQFGQINIGLAMIPPLVLLCLDSSLRSQNSNPIIIGSILGVLFSIQFFISSEMNAMMLIVYGLGIVAFFAFQAITGFRKEFSTLYFAQVSGVAIALSSTILGLPAWFALFGKGHITSGVWSGNLSSLGIDIRGLMLPHSYQTSPLTWNDRVALPSDEYIGLGIFAMSLLGLLLARRRLSAWLLAFGALLSIALSMGTRYRWLSPWRIFLHLPTTKNIAPNRFVIFALIFLALLLGMASDRIWNLATRIKSKTLVDLLGISSLAVGVLPMILYLAPAVPFPAQLLNVPRWLSTSAQRSSPADNLLVFPLAYTLDERSMAWQAIDKMRYSMAAGGGPTGQIGRNGLREAPGQKFLGEASLSFPVVPTFGTTAIRSVRDSLDGWRVSRVVLPTNRRNLSFYVVSPATVVALITAASGRIPQISTDAIVWNLRGIQFPPAVMTRPQFRDCVRVSPDHHSHLASVASCVLKLGRKV